MKNRTNTLLRETIVHGNECLIERTSLIRRCSGRSCREIPIPSTIKAELKKGIESEKRFRMFVRILIANSKIPWADKVRKGSMVQDERGKIDSIIRAHTEGLNSVTFDMMIQVKSSKRYAQVFMKKNTNVRIHTVVMNSSIDGPDRLIAILDQFYLMDVEAQKENAS